MALRDLYIFGETNRSYGPSPSHLSELIAQDCPDFGPGVEVISLVLLCPGSVTDDRGFPPLEAKQTVRFERKKNRISITFPQLRIDPDTCFSTYTNNLTTAFFEADFDTTIEALDWGLRQRVKPTDSFDVDGFLDWVKSVRARQYPSQDVLRATLIQARTDYEERQKLRDPWDLLEIDWTKTPQAARDILDDPRDWSTGDDFSPHGNDTGADILGDWRTFKSYTPDDVFAFWELRIPNSPKDETFWKVYVETHMALAFGHIRKSGQCSSALAQATCDILKKDIAASKTQEGWTHRDEWIKRATRYIELLSPFHERN